MVDDVSVRHRLRVDDANGRIVICWYSTWRTSMAKKPIQIDAVSYYSLDDRGFVEAHEVDRVEINGKRRSPETAWERLQELVNVDFRRNQVMCGDRRYHQEVLAFTPRTLRKLDGKPVVPDV